MNKLDALAVILKLEYENAPNPKDASRPKQLIGLGKLIEVAKEIDSEHKDKGNVRSC